MGFVGHKFGNFENQEFKSLPMMNDDMTIFYVDDDAEDLDFFRDVVQSLDRKINLFTHDSGDEMLDALKNPPPSPQVIFLDLNMPGKNGFELLGELRGEERWKNIPIVVFSTSSDDANVEKSFNMGANFYLPKQTSYADFKKSIDHTLTINWNNFEPNASNFLYRN